MKPSKHQRRKQRCQDLGWKVHDCAQSFALRSYTMHQLLDKHVSVGQFLSTEKTTIVFCAQSRPKSEQKPTTKNFVGFHNHSPLLTMLHDVTMILMLEWFSTEYSETKTRIITLLNLVSWGGGRRLCKSLGRVYHWDTETITLYQTMISLILEPILEKAPKTTVTSFHEVVGFYSNDCFRYCAVIIIQK